MEPHVRAEGRAEHRNTRLPWLMQLLSYVSLDRAPFFDLLAKGSINSLIQ